MTDKTEPAAVTTPVRVRPPDEMSVTVQPKNPGEMMVLAIQNNVDPEVLKKLMDLQREWEAMAAKKAYVKALTEFKRECPAVLNKDATVNFESRGGRTNYKHATLGGIVHAITPMLSANGLSVSFETEQNQDRVSVTCHITHELGHRESTKLAGPNDTSGNKNAIQAVGSAVTYLQRYTLLAALGLATAEQDDDGFRAEVAAAGKEATAKATDILAKKKEASQQTTTQPDPGRGEESQVPAGTSVVTGKVESVNEKKSPPDAEKPWVRYGIKLGGCWYSTFESKFADLARNAKEDDKEVDLEYVKAGQFTNCVGIRLAGQEVPTSPSQENNADLFPNE